MCAQNPAEFRFIKNRGQLVDMQGALIPDQEYYVNNGPATTYFSTNGFDVVYARVDDDTSTMDTLWRVNGNFLNSRTNLVITPKDTSTFIYNYYLPQCPNGVTNVHAYSGIRVQDLYTGISLEYNSTSTGYSMLFILNPERMPETIDIEFQGQDSMHIDTSGNLHVYTGLGEVIYPIPNAWYDSNYVSVSYTKTGNIVSFSTANYNGSDTLYMEINQTEGIQLNCPGNLIWSTYFGDVLNDENKAVDVDQTNGDVYLTGTTNSKHFPVTAGATFTKIAGAYDAFVSKFNVNNELNWSTYFGSENDDQGRDIVSAGNGYVYVTGWTDGTLFPVKHIGNQFYDNDGRSFIARFSKNIYQGGLDWSTYYGGTAKDHLFCITSNSQSDVFVGGHANSTDIYTQDLNDGSYYEPGNSTATGFLAWFDSNCNIKWATKFSLPGISTYIYDIKADLNKIYIAGQTEDAGPNFYNVAEDQNSYVDNVYDGHGDGFICKFGEGNGSKYSILWNTYFGGNKKDMIKSIYLGSSFLYVAGGTWSDQNFPVYQDPVNQNAYFDGILNGTNKEDIFIGKFSLTGEQLWTTLFGGNQNEEGIAICGDADKNIYVTGKTLSNPSNNYYLYNLPNAYNQNYFGGDEDAFILAFNASNEILWSTYFGGNDAELGNDLVTYGSSYLYIVGTTNTPQYTNPNQYSFPLCDPGGKSYIKKSLIPDTQPNSNIPVYHNSGYISKFDLGVINQPVGLEKFSLNLYQDLYVFPNPIANQETLTLYWPYCKEDCSAAVHIYNTLGELVYNEKVLINKRIATMKISGFNQGLYLVEIVYKNKSFTGCLLVK